MKNAFLLSALVCWSSLGASRVNITWYNSSNLKAPNEYAEMEGDGSSFTNLVFPAGLTNDYKTSATNAAQAVTNTLQAPALVGALPAISGAALTGFTSNQIPLLDAKKLVTGTLFPGQSGPLSNHTDVTVTGTSPVQGQSLHWGGSAWTNGWTHLTATATLDFASTLQATNRDMTITCNGAADGDAVMLGVPNGSTLQRSAFTAWVSAANTVTVRFSNMTTNAALDPASGTFRVVVIKP